MPFHPNVRFIRPPGAIGGLQFPTAALIQDGRIALDPTPDGGVVGGKAAFSEKFLDISIGE